MALCKASFKCVEKEGALLCPDIGLGVGKNVMSYKVSYFVCDKPLVFSFPPSLHIHIPHGFKTQPQFCDMPHFERWRSIFSLVKSRHTCDCFDQQISVRGDVMWLLSLSLRRPYSLWLVYGNIHSWSAKLTCKIYSEATVLKRKPKTYGEAMCRHASQQSQLSPIFESPLLWCKTCGWRSLQIILASGHSGDF